LQVLITLAGRKLTETFFSISEASGESQIMQAQHHPIIGRTATVISNDAFIGILSNASSTLTAMEIRQVNF